MKLKRKILGVLLGFVCIGALASCNGNKKPKEEMTFDDILSKIVTGVTTRTTENKDDFLDTKSIKLEAVQAKIRFYFNENIKIDTISFSLQWGEHCNMGVKTHTGGKICYTTTESIAKNWQRYYIDEFDSAKVYSANINFQNIECSTNDYVMLWLLPQTKCNHEVTITNFKMTFTVI